MEQSADRSVASPRSTAGFHCTAAEATSEKLLSFLMRTFIRLIIQIFSIMRACLLFFVVLFFIII